MIVFCIEDAIAEDSEGKVEAELAKILKYISEHKNKDMQLLFVRVRKRLVSFLSELTEILAGGVESVGVNSVNELVTHQKWT